MWCGRDLDAFIEDVRVDGHLIDVGDCVVAFCGLSGQLQSGAFENRFEADCVCASVIVVMFEIDEDCFKC